MCLRLRVEKHFPQNEDLRQFNVADKIFMKPCRFILTTCSAFKKAIHAYTFSQHLFRLKANVQRCFMTPLSLTHLLLLYLMYSNTHRCRLKIHSFFLPSLTFQHPMRDSRRTNIFFAFVSSVLKYLIVDTLHDSRVITWDKIMVFAECHKSSEICWASCLYVYSIIPYSLLCFVCL